MSGNLWKFSDQLDDVDAIMMQKDYITLKEGADYYNFSLKIFTRIAREAGAVYKIGKMVRIRRDILEEYLRSIQQRTENRSRLRTCHIWICFDHASYLRG